MTQELENLTQSLIKKNNLINVTLEAQEKLTDNQVKQQQMLAEKDEEIEEMKNEAQETN